MNQCRQDIIFKILIKRNLKYTYILLDIRAGRTLLFWIGPIPAVLSTDLQLIKQVLTDRTGLYQKDFMIPVLKFLFGNGVILINGDDWKRHRKVVLPAFNHETIKVR
jgi:cytochrome P450 family 709